MSTKDGGPAFPVMEVHGVNHGLPGMTLRDYFAAKALPAAWEIENKHPTYGSLGEPTYRGAAERAYQLADAMLRARREA